MTMARVTLQGPIDWRAIASLIFRKTSGGAANLSDATEGNRFVLEQVCSYLSLSDQTQYPRGDGRMDKSRRVV